MGGGKSSGSSAPVITQEQKDLLKAQTGFLTDTAFPAYQKTIGMAGEAYGQTQPASVTAANTAMDVARRTGQLQELGGAQAYGTGLGGQQNLAAYQQGLGQGLTGAGIAGAGDIASQQQALSQGLTGQSAGGIGQLARYQSGQGSQLFGQGAGGLAGATNYQQALGQSLSGQGATGLSSLFGPQYEQNQIQAALQAGREATREQLGSQNAMYGGAGGLGSSRQALADANLRQLGEQRQATAAAGAQAQVQANKAAAAQALLGAGTGALNQAQGGYGSLAGLGQGALGQSGNLYGNLLSTGQGAANTAAGIYGNLINVGQGATGQAGSLYGNLANLGAAGLGAANQAAAARIGYGQTPQDVVSKYASVIYGTPQQSTTPNFQGTQGQITSGKSSGFKL